MYLSVPMHINQLGMQEKVSISKSLQDREKHWVLNHLVSICGISDGNVIAEFWNVALNV